MCVCEENKRRKDEGKRQIKGYASPYLDIQGGTHLCTGEAARARQQAAELAILVGLTGHVSPKLGVLGGKPAPEVTAGVARLGWSKQNSRAICCDANLLKVKPASTGAAVQELSCTSKAYYRNCSNCRQACPHEYPSTAVAE
eukprot:1152973-Pelagomonas_calceolata.AAC.6